MDERVQKILAQWGVASRRQAEAMILAGRVQVNGQLWTQLGQKANLECDRICVDGIPLQPHNRPCEQSFLLHKPAGVVSTCADPQGRKTVLALFPPALQEKSGLHPVGRLDAESTGALIMTNDGDLTYRLTHPRHSIPKTYQVKVRGIPPESILKSWRDGVMLSGRLTLPAQVQVLTTSAINHRSPGTSPWSLLEITLWEGRNRQIRRVAEQLGYPVLYLHRIAIGSIRLESLKPGAYRPLKAVEIQLLKNQADQAQCLSFVSVKECNL